MARVWELICDIATSSPPAILALMTAGPVLLGIEWVILQALRAM